MWTQKSVLRRKTWNTSLERYILKSYKGYCPILVVVVLVLSYYCYYYYYPVFGYYYASPGSVHVTGKFRSHNTHRPRVFFFFLKKK